MANKRRKKKQTKAEIIQKEYSHEYTKYLARVRNQQKQGVQVQRIKRVKNPKQASIDRIKKQIAKEIRKNATVVDMLTGEAITSKEYGRKHALERNRVFIKLTPQEQEYARIQGYTTVEELKKLQRTGIIVIETTPVLDYEAIIDSWYDSLESFEPKTAYWLRQKTDALLANASNKERALFAYTYAKEPEAFPTEPYMDKATVDAVFWNILQRMGVLSSTEDFQEFLQEQDIVIEKE
jgi:hypothetical protein|uniref:Uncharacterized protein n=1 Tax=Podoviridae sp. ctyhE26 TaxID=2826594 RepID=A0A8S5R062_9CAUD|nr:MAG TPA: hypothetical protein [Podoviridae sp. ctyhE26]